MAQWKRPDWESVEEAGLGVRNVALHLDSTAYPALASAACHSPALHLRPMHTAPQADGTQ